MYTKAPKNMFVVFLGAYMVLLESTQVGVEKDKPKLKSFY